MIISAPLNSTNNYYVQRVKWNGEVVNNNWIAHSRITRGGKLEYIMMDRPDKQRGTKKQEAPYSFSNAE